MAKGDHLVVPLGPLLTHHGIDIGDGTVVHWCSGQIGKKKHLGDKVLRKVEARIRRTSFDEFCEGQPFHVRSYVDSFDPDEVVNRALSRVGESGYHLIWNNCEHFATWCKRGDLSSAQVRAVSKAVVSGTAKTLVRVAAKSSSRWAIRSLVRVSNPALLLAHVAQAGTELVALNWESTSPQTAEQIGRWVGAGSSLLIGGMVAGPVGALAGLALWGVGEVASDSILKVGKLRDGFFFS